MSQVDELMELLRTEFGIFNPAQLEEAVRHTVLDITPLCKPRSHERQEVVA